MGAMRTTVVLVVLAATGCGHEAEPANPARPTEALKDFGQAIAAGHAGKACSLMTPAIKKQMSRDASGASCEAVVDALSSRAASSTRQRLKAMTVKAVSVHGDTAEVLTAGLGQTRLRRVGGKWLVDSGPREPRLAAASAAKEMARDAATLIEKCYTDTSDYSKCTVRGPSMKGAGVTFGHTAGTVDIESAELYTWRVAARPTTGTAIFRIERNIREVRRACAPRNAPGCRDGTW